MQSVSDTGHQFMSVARREALADNEAQTSSEALEPRDVLPSDITLLIEHVGTIPGAGGDANFQSPVSINGSIFGIDSSGGMIYRARGDGQDAPELVFDIATDLPEGLVVNYNEGIANMVGGQGNKVYVAFTSDTLPEGDFEALGLPSYAQPGLAGWPAIFVDDFYRLGAEDLANFPAFPGLNWTFGLKWQVIYEFTVTGQGFGDATPIAAFELQSSNTGHHGTGMEFADGQILWATGDNLPFGLNGREGAQDDNEIPSKLFLIDPDSGEIELAAEGLRNVQHLDISRIGGVEYLAFADIGGVTSEEINVVPLADILDTSVVENFGWGVAEDGLSREGTFYVGGSDNGIAGIFGTQPPATGVAPLGEEGFIQPIAQYGRAGPFNFVASSGPVISDTSFDSLTTLFGDLPSGLLFGTTDPLDTLDADVFILNLVDAEGGDTSLFELAEGRPDPRFFTFNDGSAGVLLEATGDYYRLTEIAAEPDLFG